jgi:hypothetical protein
MITLEGRTILIAFGAGLLATLGFIIWALLATPAGFPVDDAWIHQVFARNLAFNQEFSYNLGEPVAGSTAPLWTLLLVPGYFFRNFYIIWAFIAGWVLLALSGLEVYRLYLQMFGTEREKAALVALLFALLDWRLVWASASGMETLLFIYLSLLVVRVYLEKTEEATTRSYARLGLVGGALTLVRPEGMVLLGLVGLDIGRRALANRNSASADKPAPVVKLVKRGMALVFGFGALMLPYALLNYSMSGSILPNTFSAKTAAYAADHSPAKALAYLGEALLELLLRVPALALFPGLIICLGLAATRRINFNWLPLVWVVALVGLYAWRLPVTYHHARYLMPLVPFILLYGVRGSEELLGWLRKIRLPVVARFAPALAFLVLAFGYITGAGAYRFDVKFINDEQVKVGQWLRDNTPEDTIVASHDIGAIGFFSERKLVDTAGLVSPKYVPLVRDQPAILQKLREDRVSYFALLPTWYPALNEQLGREGRKVFQPQETYLEQYGEKNMAVFRLKD